MRINRPLQSGFTLIELMIVVAIIAILATIGYPAYTDSVQKTRRADAKVALTETAQRLERCYTMFSVYNHDDCEPPPDDFPFDSPEGYYEIQATVLNASTFTLTAARQGAQAADAKCGNFTLTHTGAKGISGSWTVERCW